MKYAILLMSMMMLMTIERVSSIAIPSVRQQQFLDWKMTMFVHFSITTFTGSQNGTQSPSAFAPNPDTLNPRQWCETAKKMGAPVAVLTSKHEAGYIIWQTNEPIGRNFSIAQSSTVPSRDLVDEFTQACREVGVLPGLYFTTTDAYQTSLNNSQDVFRKAQLQQIEELSTRYGEISYFWFDHHEVTSSADLWFDIDNIVREKQPGAVILGMDTSQVGAESGFSPYPWYYSCNTVDNTTHGRCKFIFLCLFLISPSPHLHENNNINKIGINRTGIPTGQFFKAAESDCSIFGGCHPWFCCGTVQTLEQSMAHWEGTVGRGSEFIMNVPPNTSGVVDESLVSSASAFGDEVSRRYGQYGNNLSEYYGTLVNARSDFVKIGAKLTIDVTNNTFFDRIWVSEDMKSNGQRVMKYHFEILSDSWSYWVPLRLNETSGGLTIGNAHIDTPGRHEGVEKLRFVLDEAIGDQDVPVSIHVAVFATGADS